MLTDRQCSDLYQKYYGNILRYCTAMLYGYHRNAAADITQEVFLTMLQNRETLACDDEIFGWLCRTARILTKNWLRENRTKQFLRMQGGFDIPGRQYEEPAFTEGEGPFARLTPEEYELLEDYYDTPHGEKQPIAEKYRMTMSQLYDKIWRIKEKIIKKR